MAANSTNSCAADPFDRPSLRGALGIAVALGPGLSVPLNVLIIVLTFRITFSAESKYKWFVLNMASTDVLFGLHSALTTPLVDVFLEFLNDGPQLLCNAPRCFFVTYPSTIFASPMAFSGAMLLFNRFVALRLNKVWFERLFAPWPCVLMCAVVWLPGWVYALAVFAHGRGCRNVCPVCGAVLGLSFVGGQVLAAYFTVSVYAYLKRHQKIVDTLAQKRRINENRRLLRAFAIQGLYPAAAILPAILYFFLVPAEYRTATGEGLTIALFFCNPLADAIATLCILKPYRAAVLSMLNPNAVAPMITTTQKPKTEQ